MLLTTTTTNKLQSDVMSGDVSNKRLIDGKDSGPGILMPVTERM